MGIFHTLEDILSNWSCQVNETMSQLSRMLLILDINGTLLSRHPRSEDSNKKLSAVKALLREKVQREPDFILHGYWYYFRPHVQTLLKHCFENFNVGVWTSSLPMTAYPVVAQLFGPKLNLSNTILDDGKHPATTVNSKSQFKIPFQESEQLCKTYENELQQLKRTQPAYKFNSMDPTSMSSLEEKILQCNTLKLINQQRQCTESNLKTHIMDGCDSPMDNFSSKKDSYQLRLLWTRRRCILRHASNNDDPSHFRHKPIAIKDLSQLWKYRGMDAKAYKALPSDDCYYSRICLPQLRNICVGPGNSIRLIEMNSDVAHKLSVPFYYPTFPPTKRSDFHPERTLLIDDASIKFGLHTGNGLKIPEYNILNDPLGQDSTLLTLISFLEKLKAWSKEKPSETRPSNLSMFLAQYEHLFS